MIIHSHKGSSKFKKTSTIIPVKKVDVAERPEEKKESSFFIPSFEEKEKEENI